MSRLLLALLFTFSLWPSLATGGYGSAQVPTSSIRPAAEHMASGDGGALRSLNGWQLLPRLDTGLPNAGRDGDGRSGASGGFARAASPPALASGRIQQAEDALLGAGVLLLRYDHLPYFATAPPAR
jgi:hypothetical protein